jgi:glycosyltransferase involved in cell wall biosynthesis
MSFARRLISRLRSSIKNSKVHSEEHGKKIFEHFLFDTYDKYDFIIFDDFLPNLLGSWRSIEISEYLKKYQNSQLICLLNHYSENGMNADKNFETDKIEFLNKYNLHSKRDSIVAKSETSKININSRLAYCIFYGNLLEIYPLLELHNIPFVFTLYPGGGFTFYNENCERFLIDVKLSPLFKGVIVTQQSVYDYLVKRMAFPSEKIEFLYGCPLDFDEYSIPVDKKYYGLGKGTLDICFVAAKYTKFGIDKGFDVFCEVASFLSEKYNFIKFHVVGGFNHFDLPYPVKENNVSFYGYRYFEWFKEFYFNMDIILSPVKPNVLALGAFDGFPTAAVIDAGMFGVAMMAADPTGDNVFASFEDDKDIFLIESNAYNVIKRINHLISKPENIKIVAEAGNKKLKRFFNREYQINKRIKFMDKILFEL